MSFRTESLKIELGFKKKHNNLRYLFALSALSTFPSSCVVFQMIYITDHKTHEQHNHERSIIFNLSL